MAGRFRVALAVAVLLASALLLFLLRGHDAMAQQTIWSVQTGTAHTDATYGLARDQQGYLYLVGNTDGDLGDPSAGKADLVIVKYDPSGDLIWSRQFGSAGYDLAQGAALGGDGNLYLVGYTDGHLYASNSGGLDAFVAKFSPDGTLLWGRQFGSGGDDEGSGIAADQAGNVYAVGTTYGPLFGPMSAERDSDCFLVKYDSEGNQLWGKRIGNSHQDEGGDICVGTQGTLFLAGSTTDLFNPDAPYVDAFLAKTDSDGNILWGRQFGGGGTLVDGAGSLIADESGNAYIGGTINVGDALREPGAPTPDGFVAKYDSGGNQVWLNQLSTAGDEGVIDLTMDSQGNIVAVGSTSASLFAANAGGDDAFAVKYSPSGTALWSHQFGTSSDDSASGVAGCTDGGLCVAGTTEGSLYGTNAGGEDIFLVKFQQ